MILAVGRESDSTFTHDLHKGLYFHCIMANPPSNLRGEYDENLKNDSRWVDYDLIMGLFAFYGFAPSFNDSHENICGIYSRVPASRGFAVRDEIFCW